MNNWGCIVHFEFQMKLTECREVSYENGGNAKCIKIGRNHKIKESFLRRLGDK